ncbi:MAG: hypothetical protein RBT69_10365 [Spirochaetia bacterium]|nr:hypothetical protein [Spirochaetia bacterium]
MRKTIFLLLAFFTALSFASAVDFGGNLENYSLITSDSDSQKQTDKASLWFAVTPSETIYIKGQGSFAYSMDDYDFLADIDYLYITQDFPGAINEQSAFTYKAGRFFQSEFTGKVFAHRLDGALFTLALPIANFSLGAGYTGLLLKPVSGVNNTAADIIDDGDDDVKLAPKKMIVRLGASFIDIMPAQQLDVSLVTQFDMRSDDLLEDGDAEGDGNGGKLNTYYIGAGLSGAFSASFVYDTYLYYQLGKTLTAFDDEYKDKPISAFLGGGSVSYLNREFYSSRATASLLYASGDDDNKSVYEGNTKGSGTQFMPISKSSTGLIFSPTPSNLLKMGLEYSMKPFAERKDMMKNFQAALSAAMFYKASEGAVSESKAALSDEKYLGTEALLTLNFRPVSDFGLTLAGGAFFPNDKKDGPMGEDYRDTEAGVMINASLSF